MDEYQANRNGPVAINGGDAIDARDSQGTVIKPQGPVTQYFGPVHQLTEGINRLPTDYAIRIQNFLTEYLGTPQHPVPFGGRQAMLEILDAWLSNPTAPPYLLLAAPAGRGKSAVLAHWSIHLEPDPNVSVVFIPVSIRFRTNLAGVVFAALAARLAVLYGEKVLITDQSAEFWRGIASSYLSRPLPDGRSLVVILDGVDEAADWEPGADLFPLAPPPGVRVMVAARYRAGDADATGWLRCLGWERPGLALSPALRPLNRHGVADVLNKMGMPLDILARDIDIVTELHRLSGGDPLLVRLYVDDLWTRGKAAARLTPTDLYTIQPGYEGYFARWWEEQRKLWGKQSPLKEPVVQVLLNLLACALGPLMRDDLLKLGAMEELNTWMLAEALHSLERFVIGDGKQQGYIFSHPKLAAYFYDKLSGGENEEWEGRFLRWGKEILAKLNTQILPQRGVPAYIVQYYGAHLGRAQVDAVDLYALVSEGWLRAWETLESTISGFLNDVDRAWVRADREDDIGMQIRCALCYASVRTLRAHIPIDLLVKVVENGIVPPEQVLIIVKGKFGHEAKAAALIALVPILAKISEELTQKALVIARGITSLVWCVKSLMALVPYVSGLTQEQIFRGILSRLEQIQDAEFQSFILEGLAKQLPHHLLEQALSLAKGIESHGWGALAISHLIELPDAALYFSVEEAVNIAQQAIWSSIEAEAQSRDSNPDSMWHFMSLLRNSEPEVRTKALVRLTPYLSDEYMESVWRMMLDFERGFELKEFFEVCWSRLSVNALREALPTIWRISSSSFFDHSDLSSYVPYLLQRIPQDTIASVKMIEDPWRQVMVLIAVASHITDALQEELLQETFDVAIKIEDKLKYAQILMRLAEVHGLPQSLLTKAVQAIWKTVRGKDDNGVEYAGILLDLIPLLTPASQLRVLEKAISMVRRLPDYVENESLIFRRHGYSLYPKAATLSKLVSRLSELAQSTLLEEVIGIIRDIKTEKVRVSALLEIELSRLPVNLQREIVNIADETLSELNVRINTLTHLIPRVNASIRTDVFDRTLKLARQLPVLLPKDDREIGAGASPRTAALAALAMCDLQWATATLEEALTTTGDIMDRKDHDQVLGMLVPYLLWVSPERALEVAITIKDHNQQFKILNEYFLEIDRNFPSPFFPSLLSQGKKVSSTPEVPQWLKGQALDYAWPLAQTLDDVDALVNLSTQLAAPQKQEALEQAWSLSQTIGDTYASVTTSAHLLARLPDSLRLEAQKEIWQSTAKITNSVERIQALVTLALQLTEPSLKTEVLARLEQEIGAAVSESNADKMTELAQQLAQNPEMVSTVKVILRRILSIKPTVLVDLDDRNDTRTFDEIALSHKTFKTIAEVMARIDDVGGLISVDALANTFNGEEAVAALACVTVAWKQLGYEDKAFNASQKALDRIREIEDVRTRSTALRRFVPYVPESVVSLDN